MRRRLLAALAASSLLCSATLHAQTSVTWDGGDGDWKAANWNGGMTAAEVFADKTSGTDGGHNVTIGGGTVTYDQNADGDFTFRQDNGPSNLTITGGAELTMDEETCCEDGQWTRWDATNLVLDNGTMSRTLTTGQGSLSGGAWVVGSWNVDDDQEINIHIKNGGRLENDGVFLMGYATDMGANVSARVRIDGGHMDLTGGDNYPLGDLFWENDLVISSHDEFSAGGKNFDGHINFIGNAAGSITVDEGGIANPYLSEFDVWEGVTDKITYEELWNRDLLRANGLSARSGRTFADFFDVVGDSGSADYQVIKKVAPEVVWDGGDGRFHDPNWDGGMYIDEVTGRENGTRGGHILVIGGGANVEYDPNIDTGIDDDLNLRFDNGYSKLVVKEGATLTFNSSYNPDFTDGYWTQLDSETEIDGGTFRRTFDGDMNSGGALIFGSWGARAGSEINVYLKNGGTIENDGVLLIGYEDEMAQDVSVTMTINDGHLDLTGGGNEPLGDLFWENDLVITSHDPLAFNEDDVLSGFESKINFTGPGTITVDEDGIANPHLNNFDIWENVTTKISYEDLWDRGLLQANGLSGLDGETFADYFSVEGSSGSEDYKLTSLLMDLPTFLADFDGNGVVDGDDLTDPTLGWEARFGDDLDGADFLNWQREFGLGAGGAASVGAVPEPSTVGLLLLAASIAGVVARKRSQRPS